MYEYANARIRALRSRLLRAHELDALAAQPDLGHLVAALARTDYGPALEEARRQRAGLPLIDQALAGNLSRRVRGLLTFFTLELPTPSEGRRLVAIILARADVRNVVAVLRGKAANAAPDQIRGALLPSGELDEDKLARLAETTQVAACIKQLETWRLPYALSLAEALRAFERDHLLPPLELAMRHGFLEWASKELQRGGGNVHLLRSALALEADAANVLTVLRLLGQNARPEPGVLTTLLVPGGALTEGELISLSESTTVAGAATALGNTPLGRVFRAGLASAALVSEAVAAERALERYLARWAQAQVYRDPLGISLAFAYHAAKVDEVRNLRLIARGVAKHWPSERVRYWLTTSAA